MKTCFIFGNWFCSKSEDFFHISVACTLWEKYSPSSVSVPPFCKMAVVFCWVQWILCAAKAGGEFLGVRETIRTSEWVPVTLGGSHADYKLCRKDLVDSVNCVASVTAVSRSSSQSLLAKLLELVSSLNLVTEDFPCFPFPLRGKKKLEINSKVTHFKCSKANKWKLRCSQKK